MQNSEENTCPRPSLEILLKREFNADVFLLISQIFKNTFIYRAPPAAASARRDAMHTCKSPVDIWTWVKLYSGYFGLYITVTLFSGQQCYRKCIEKNIHESDDNAFFSRAAFLQYLQTCLLYKS